jgi:hypothetical protein
VRREEAAKKLMAEGLLKACRLAVVDGCYDRAADLARQAYAVDPARVEADPMVIKLDLLNGWMLRQAAPKVKMLTCPAGTSEQCEVGPDGETKLMPQLPGLFGDMVEAMEAVLAQMPIR